MTRFVYLDESGISNPDQEPYTVMAGAIIDPDHQWRALETYYRDLANTCFPNEDTYRFVFEAKHIWNGSNKFSREKWTFQQRIRLLHQLARVPKMFNIPITMAALKRSELRKIVLQKYPNIKEHEIKSIEYTEVFIESAMCVDYWIRKNAPTEVATLIAEDTPRIKKNIRFLHEAYTNQETNRNDAFISSHIIDAVFYAKKKESILLQIADHCAFIIKRKLMGSTEFEPLYKEIYPQITYDKDQPHLIIANILIADIEPFTPE